MQTVEIEHEIRTFLVDNFLFGDGQKLQDSVPLLGNVIDSTGVMELVLFLQDRFSITVEDEEVVADNLDSVKSAAAFVGRKLVEKSSVT
jgi:acyl carrier protein